VVTGRCFGVISLILFVILAPVFLLPTPLTQHNVRSSFLSIHHSSSVTSSLFHSWLKTHLLRPNKSFPTIDCLSPSRLGLGPYLLFHKLTVLSRGSATFSDQRRVSDVLRVQVPADATQNAGPVDRHRSTVNCNPATPHRQTAA